MKSARSLFALLMVFWMTGADLMAQCSQCKAAAAAKDENGNLIATSINTGVLYLLALPVFLPVIVGGVWWYLSRVRKLELDNSQS